MSDLVIGEGVALDLRLAKLPSRALAKLLDLLVQATGGSILAGVIGMLLVNVDGAVAAGIMILFVAMVVVGYPTLMETVTRGRTLGKMALGLRVVRTDGGPIAFRHALVRALAGIFDFIVTAGTLAVVTSFCSKDGRRLGDLLAGTVVIRDRAPDAGVSAMGMAALAMPYPLLGWAQAQDLSMVPDDLALAARQYLTRMAELRPEIAERMGVELATEAARYVAPPPNTPPWAFLAAITAERRARQIMKAEAERRTAWEQAQRVAAAQGVYAGAGVPYGAQVSAPQGAYTAPPAPPQHPRPSGQLPPQSPAPAPTGPEDGDEGFKPPA